MFQPACPPLLARGMGLMQPHGGSRQGGVHGLLCNHSQYLIQPAQAPLMLTQQPAPQVLLQWQVTAARVACRQQVVAQAPLWPQRSAEWLLWRLPVQVVAAYLAVQVAGRQVLLL